MAELIGFKKIKIAVFISGKGSNLLNLIIHSKKKESSFTIELVLSNNKNASGLKYAQKFKIPFIVLNYKKKKNAEITALKKIKKKKIQLICLAGFMKILSVSFINNFKGRILNIHPSLLPRYKGLNTHQRALKNNERFSGCTVHLVNAKLDSGKIILQKKVKIFKNDNADKLALRILKQEHKIYPIALKKIISDFQRKNLFQF